MVGTLLNEQYPTIPPTYTAPTLDQSIARTTNDEDTGTVEICVVGGGIAVAAVLKTTNCTSDNYACGMFYFLCCTQLHQL